MKENQRNQKHSTYEHGVVKAMPQFNEGHWEKKMDDVSVADGRYSSEFNQAEEYKQMVDKQAAYVRSHRAEH